MPDESRKTCSVCLEEKPISDFYMQSKNPQHRAYNRPQGRCKVCVRGQVADYQAKNPEKTTRAVCNARLKANYGISLEEYELLLVSQGSVCAICGTPPKRRRLAVDHCHTTGLVRGLLCMPCNQGLGAFRDRPESIRAAISYLSGASDA